MIERVPAGSSPSLVVVTAGLSTPSSTRLLGDRLATATLRALAAGGTQATTRVVELRDHAQDLVNHLLTGFPAAGLRDVLDSVLASDGLIAVSPIFSASYSGLFKLFFDVHERDGLAGKPVLLAATGGTARHSLALDHALRPLFAYLGAAVVPTAVFAAADDWGSIDEAAPPTGGDPRASRDDAGPLAQRIDRAGRELARAITVAEKVPRGDPFADPTPFDELLGRG